jgi:hypothetical protein
MCGAKKFGIAGIIIGVVSLGYALYLRRKIYKGLKELEDLFGTPRKSRRPSPIDEWSGYPTEGAVSLGNKQAMDMAANTHLQFHNKEDIIGVDLASVETEAGIEFKFDPVPTKALIDDISDLSKKKKVKGAAKHE